MSDSNNTHQETTSETTDNAIPSKWYEYMGELFKEVPVSMSVITVCLILFAITVIKDKSIFSFNIPTLISMGGAHNIRIFKGEYWRLISSTFLHDGILHITVNLILFFIFGATVELLFGKFRYLLLLLVTAFVSECFSFYFKSDEVVISVGLSGALLGVLGAFLSFGALSRDSKIRKEFLNIRFLLFLAVAIIGGSSENVNITSHFFGFISGLIIALPYYYFKNFLQKEKTASGIFYAMALAMIMLGTWIVNTTPKDLFHYNNLMDGIITEHEQMVNTWNQWNGTSYVDKRPTAMEHINRMNHFIGLIRSETPKLKVNQLLRDDAKLYSELLRADIDYLQLIFREPTYQVQVPQDSFDRVQHFRDSLFNLYWHK